MKVKPDADYVGGHEREGAVIGETPNDALHDIAFADLGVAAFFRDALFSTRRSTTTSSSATSSSLNVGSYRDIGYRCVSREKLCDRTYLETLEVVVSALPNSGSRP
ncbi:hypothetical protein [Acidisarcina polymorpha]|uniref:hypothetical protein n=1 Tax=Acidisarcina polymorpha TaxID=2211140 RepID=UPI001F448F0A|nr:hypothetical protein [Acidisarcina polymorpha]